MAEPARVEVCESTLRAGAAGKVLIVTSALALAECLKMRGERPIPADIRQKVVDFFKSDFIHVRNVTRAIAENARDLVWDHGVPPKDAIHVATALDARLDLMNAYDHDLLKCSGKIGSPRLIIEHPAPPPQGEFDLADAPPA